MTVSILHDYATLSRPFLQCVASNVPLIKGFFNKFIFTTKFMVSGDHGPWRDISIPSQAVILKIKE
jgi:hypothetical protein